MPARSSSKREQATMADVAAEAGVSLKTVSRVVNGEPAVRPATAARVEASIRALGFRRNDLARALRQGQSSRILGLITEDVANPFYSAISRGVEEEVRGRGLLVVSASSDEDPRREQRLVQLLSERRIDGLLVVPTGNDHAALSPELVGAPVVFVDRPPVGVESDVALLDNAGGARAAVEHLRARGRRRIALIGDRPGLYTTTERLRGYRAGLAGVEEVVRLGCPDASSAEAAVRELLDGAQPPDALFACNNRITVGALQALAGLGDSRRPALVGFDDFELAPLLSPPVTVVAYDAVELGRAAARLLMERLEDAERPPRRIEVGTSLLVRGSS